MVRRLSDAGYDVIGDLDELRVPVVLPDLRSPADVSAEELQVAGSELVGALLGDVRETQLRLRQLERRPARHWRPVPRLRAEGLSGLLGALRRRSTQTLPSQSDETPLSVVDVGASGVVQSSRRQRAGRPLRWGSGPRPWSLVLSRGRSDSASAEDDTSELGRLEVAASP